MPKKAVPPKDVLIEKGLPASPDAEKAVLGAILIDNYAYDLVSDMLHVDDFFVDAHRRIFQRMVALRKGVPVRPIDFTSLTEELLATKELEIIGNVSYLSSLTDGLPRAVNTEHHARIVKDKSVLRNLIHTAHSIVQEGLDGAYRIGEEDSQNAFQAFLDRAESSIMAVRPAARSGLICVSDIVPSLRTPQKPLGVSTGFTSIDEKMACGGWATGELSFILARTSHGKTAMMLNQAYCQASAGKVVAIFSLETAKERLVDRLCCQLSGVSLFKKMHDMLNTWEQDLIEDARKEIAKLPLYINDMAGLNANDVNAQVRRLPRDVGQKVDIVWGDFLRLLKHLPGKWGTTNDAVAETVTTLKRGAQEFGCPYVWLSQIGRFQTDKKSGKPEPAPTISDARDCGEIENQSYTMVGLYRLDQAMKMVNPDWVKNGEAQFDLLKDKDGPCGVVPLSFVGSSMNFAEVETAAPEPSVEQRSLPK
ncbi:MAG TPA: DnaB-like helicase C-terminal domain-containing protein [Bryobacteraceae bacterium]|nr:DnaB-like helicase C-terminal domain-containing protein [Bryobacteraceae bacterium]